MLAATDRVVIRWIAYLQRIAALYARGRLTVRPVQAEQAPDVTQFYSSKKKATAAGSSMTGGTMLTGPSGVDNSMLSTGKTLLGS